MTHEHSGHGSHAHDFRAAGRRVLIFVLILTICHMAIEIVGGIVSGSLGVLAHASHVVIDVVAIGLALFAMWIAERPASITRTFGYQRIEVLVVMINALALWVLANWIIFGAYQRLVGLEHDHEHELKGGIIVIVALAGLAIKLVAAGALYRSSRHNINVEGVFWHVMVDLLESLGVLVAGTLVLLFDWEIADPILGIVIAVLILFNSGRLAVRMFRVLVEGVPQRLDMYRLCSALEDVEGVTLLHDVHAWTVTSGYDALTAHVLVDPDYPGDHASLLRRLRRIAYEDFGVHHITLQLETSAAECAENHHVGHLEARTHAEARQANIGIRSTVRGDGNAT